MTATEASASGRPARPDAVDHPDLLTPEWLTDAFGAEGRTVTIASVAYEAVGTGQMGSSYRLTLETSSPGTPSTIVAKLPSDDPDMRATVAPGYRAEVGFYRDLVDGLAVRTPVCHGTAMNDDGSVFVLLMQDMAPARQGDQFAGASIDEARAALVNLAGLHGPRWGDPTLAELDFLSFTEPDVAEFLGQLTVSAADVFLERFAGRVADDDVAVLRDAAALVGPWLAARGDRFSVIHGDYRMDNLLIAPDGTVTTVDWQTVAIGLPARDVAYFCGTSLTTDDRRRHEDELLRTYHAALVDLGVDDHPLDECIDDYRFALLQAPMIILLGAAYGTPTERGDAMFLTMVERSCAAIRDLGTIELVRAEVTGSSS